MKTPRQHVFEKRKYRREFRAGTASTKIPKHALIFTGLLGQLKQNMEKTRY